MEWAPSRGAAGAAPKGELGNLRAGLVFPRVAGVARYFFIKLIRAALCNNNNNNNNNNNTQHHHQGAATSLRMMTRTRTFFFKIYVRNARAPTDGPSHA
jgi:hypothetical protein